MITRVLKWKRPRPLALLAIVGAFVAAGLFAAVALADSSGNPDCDIQVQNKTETDICTTDALAKVRYIGDKSQSFGSSGTGTFSPFVRLQGSTSEAGYNTDGTLEFDTKAGTWTSTILVSEIPIRTEDGCIDCWELWVDINESNSTSTVSLNEMEIWFTTNANLTGYDVPWTIAQAQKQYDFSGEILINDVNQGSGRGDLRYMVPQTGITIPTNCNYGNTACTTYFLLYSEWGTTTGFESDGGFEEWKVKIYPIPNTTATQLKNTNGTVDTGNDTNIADGGSVTIGTGVYDTATITGATADAGGTVSYYYQNQTVPGCLNGTLIGSAVAVTNGVVPASATVTLSTAGTFEFWAVYSGDPPDNNASTSPCGSETVVVGPNTPAPHSTPVVQIKDTLTVTGFTADVTGNVLVGLYTSADCTTGQIGSNATFAASLFVGGGSQETSFVAVTAGTKYFKISYAGDNNNTLFSSCAENVGVTITSLA